MATDISDPDAFPHHQAAAVLLRYEDAETAPGLSASAAIAHVTINRPGRSNALDRPTMAAFVDAMTQAGARADVRAVVISGAGDRAFVGGADIMAMSKLDAVGAREFITAVHLCCHAVRACPVPVIARINGVAFGAGLELAASCDLVVAGEKARFGMPEVKLGIPSVVEAALLPRIAGEARAREMLLLGDIFDASEAQRCGLVHRVVPAHELDEVIAAWTASLLANGPRAVRVQKALMNRWQNLSLENAINLSIDAFAECFIDLPGEAAEPRRMMQAWIDNRRTREIGN